MKLDDLIHRHGFTIQQTGGGCEAYEMDLLHGRYILVTADDDPSLPVEGDKICVGAYVEDHSEPITQRAFYGWHYDDADSWIAGLSSFARGVV